MTSTKFGGILLEVLLAALLLATFEALWALLEICLLFRFMHS